MSDEKVHAETTSFRMIMVQPGSRTILAVDTAGSLFLPRVSVLKGTRLTEQLQKEVKSRWGLVAAVLEFLPSRDCVVAEILAPGVNPQLRAVALNNISGYELTEADRACAQSILEGSHSSPLSRIGWIDEAIAWVEGSVGKRLRSNSDLEQFNAGGGFALLRFQMLDGTEYWLKATGAPNIHEYSVTAYLSGRPVSDGEAHGFVPRIISARPQWNAWLTSGEARPISLIEPDDSQAYLILEKAVRSFSRLQVAVVGQEADLIRSGAFDHRLDLLVKRSEELFDYLQEAMTFQTSVKVPRIEKSRLKALHRIFVEVCHEVSALGIPDSIVHGDLNQGNILFGGHCQFIDWSEACVGNPLISLQHLLMLNKTGNASRERHRNLCLRRAYCHEWRTLCDVHTLYRGLRFMPILAAVSALYGRGVWLTTSERDKPHRQSFSRTIARIIDQAATNLDLPEVACV